MYNVHTYTQIAHFVNKYAISESNNHVKLSSSIKIYGLEISTLILFNRGVLRLRRERGKREFLANSFFTIAWSIICIFTFWTPIVVVHVQTFIFYLGLQDKTDQLFGGNEISIFYKKFAYPLIFFNLLILFSMEFCLELFKHFRYQFIRFDDKSS